MDKHKHAIGNQEFTETHQNYSFAQYNSRQSALQFIQTFELFFFVQQLSAQWNSIGSGHMHIVVPFND